MSTSAGDETARKQAEHLQRRRIALERAMRKDVEQLRKIIHGPAAKK